MCFALVSLWIGLGSISAVSGAPIRVPVLIYHRFAPDVSNDMTVAPETFDSQLDTIRKEGYTVVRLEDLVSALRGSGQSLPARAVVLTADDGNETVYTEMFPRLVRRKIPVTLFIYPSAISNASYALTWHQLEEMTASGLVDVESHSYWHPNFAVERRRLPSAEFRRFSENQLVRSKRVIESRLGEAVNLLAWPFGLYDEEVAGLASKAGYIAAFTIERRPVSATDSLMALPRYIVVNSDTGKRFEGLLAGEGR